MLSGECETIRDVLRRLAVVAVLVCAALSAEARRPMGDGVYGGDTTSVVACDEYEWYGVTYTESDIITRTLTGQNGQDSVATLILIISHSSLSSDTLTACDSYLWEANGVVYGYSCIDTVFLTNADGCDSVLTLTLTINYSDTIVDSTEHVCTGDTLVWEGMTLTETGTYRRTMPNGVGCDSLWMMTLVVHEPDDVTVDDTCAYKDLPWTYGERVYEDSVRNDIFELKSQYGCDSTVHYNLTVVWRCDAFLQFPSVVTPNGDGINDRFVIYNLVEEGCYPRNRLSIYNRWGWLMYDKENISEDDEFWSPENALPGTYFFRFEGYGFSDKMERRGSFEILRTP